MTHSMFPFRWGRQTLKFLGIDPAVAVVLGGNVGIGILSLIQISLIAARLTPAEQGVNFNYLALFQIILLFDLGFGLVIQQLVSHQRAFLHETPGRVLEGPPVHQARLGSLPVTLAYCVIMALGGKLWAFPGGQVCGLAVPLVWLFAIRRPLLANLWRTSTGEARLTWRRDVRPFQSRIALSLISAQAIQLIVPIALRCYGPEESGRLGMSLAVVAALQMLGLTWLETRVPVFGNLIAKRNWTELDRVYRHVLTRSTAFLAVILGLLVAGTFWLNASEQPQAQALMSRFLKPVPGTLLCMIILSNHVFYVRAAYLRAHCKEPYMVVTVLQGAALVVTMLIAGQLGSLETMLGGCLFWTLVLGQGVG